MNYIPIFRGKDDTNELLPHERYSEWFSKKERITALRDSEWRYGNLVDVSRSWEDEKLCILSNGNNYFILKHTIGMSTGILADKSHRGESELDRMIFDGDIISDGENKFLIKWDCDYAMFVAVHLFCFGVSEDDELLSEVFLDDKSIIGNIHDNPDMLEA